MPSNPSRLFSLQIEPAQHQIDSRVHQKRRSRGRHCNLQCTKYSSTTITVRITPRRDSRWYPEVGPAQDPPTPARNIQPPAASSSSATAPLFSGVCTPFWASARLFGRLHAFSPVGNLKSAQGQAFARLSLNAQDSNAMVWICCVTVYHLEPVKYHPVLTGRSSWSLKL